MDMGDMMAGMGWWMVLWGALALALLTLAVVAAVRLLRGRPSEQRQLPDGSAERELQQRYAAGELSHDQYLERLHILRNQ
ncbi:MAG: SHOCT domain-containing protein [Thermocrispum sp.]